MKNRIILFALFAFMNMQAHAQVAFHDAVKLSSYVTSGKFRSADTAEVNAVCRILKKYLREPERSSSSLTTAAIVGFYTPATQNPFLAGYFKAGYGAGATGIGNSLQRLATNVGNTDVTMIADGIAKFLVKRTKEELTATFFQKFYDFLDAQKDLQVLFPSTTTILRSAGDEIYNYHAYLPALREAFQNDLDAIFPNGYEWTKSNGPWISELKGLTDQRIYVGLKTGFFVGKELHSGRHPGDILVTLQSMNLSGATPTSDNIDFTKLDPNLPPMLATANLLSQSLRSLSSDEYWVNAQELRAFGNQDVLKIYFGLIYQKAKVEDITFNNGKKLIDILAGAAADMTKLQSFLTLVQSKLSDLRNDIQTITQAEVKQASDYFELANSTYGFVKSLSGTQLLTASSALADGPSSDVHFYSTQLSALWSHIQSKSYNSAVYDAYSVLDKALATYAKKEELRLFLKYATFVASVATAESSDEVEAAIEAIVLPPGSASIKRKSKTNISLNAFVGLAPGYEWHGSKTKAGKMTLAVSAPIGVAFSWGWYNAPTPACKCTGYTEKGSWTAMLSLVDLGAVTAYRFNSEDEEALPKLTLSNIFAPGLYIIYGVSKTPLSIGGGVQMGPQLRKVTADAATVDNSIIYTAKLFVAVDIPLLNFKTKAR